MKWTSNNGEVTYNGCSSPLLWFLDKKKKKNLYLQLFVYCDLWSKLISTCSWQNTALKAEALCANSSNCKTLWWKNWKLSPLWNTAREAAPVLSCSKRTSSTENSCHALVNCCHGKGPPDPGRGWSLAGTGRCLFLNLLWSAQSLLSNYWLWCGTFCFILLEIKSDELKLWSKEERKTKDYFSATPVQSHL